MPAQLTPLLSSFHSLVFCCLKGPHQRGSFFEPLIFHVLKNPSRPRDISIMIDIASVLRKLDDTYDEGTQEVKEYGLRFITSDGRLRTMVCRKNEKNPGKGSRKPTRLPHYNLKRSGTMLVTEASHPRAIKPATICAFRDYKTTAWIPVFH